jgi:ribosomal protein S18 acetylase RimI-like enzyme
MRTFTPTIRPAREEDDVALAKALGTVVETIEHRRHGQEPGHAMFVADVEGQAAGSVSVNTFDSIPGLLHLFALGVAPALQGRGIGTLLIQHVEATARQMGLAGVWLDVGIDNADAMRLYHRLGYRVEGDVVINRYTRYPGGETAEEACYRMLKRFEPEPG